MVEGKDSCVEPAKGPILEQPEEEQEVSDPSREVRNMSVTAGKPAPDFEASAFVDDGFRNIRLSDYKGKWVVLCFYPGDFTFV